MSLKGQGNCHGCSSVIGAYLYHFSKLLGLDVKYRSGNMDSQPNPNLDYHQAIEVTCRPSMESVIVDLFLEGISDNNEGFIGLPASEFYQHSFYPNGKLVIGTKSAEP